MLFIFLRRPEKEEKFCKSSVELDFGEMKIQIQSIFNTTVNPLKMCLKVKYRILKFQLLYFVGYLQVIQFAEKRVATQSSTYFIREKG